jgi:Calpain family cysteine protease/RTX calcium-binding nonapeptide repeat (4 copies)
MSAKVTRTPKLGLESLEAREVPAVVSVQTVGNEIRVTANDNGSNVTISRPNAISDLKITDNQTGQKWTINWSVYLDLKKVVFVGGSGADHVSAAGAWQRVDLRGGGGNDVLTGGALNDRLDGGSGNDILKGGGGNDALYGRGGFDYLYGEAGSDFLDGGGQSGDFLSGGAGYDFDARHPVLNGTTDTDVNQGNTPTCWVLAPIAAAARQGIDFASRITYLGNGDYRVKLMNEDGGHSYQIVNLEGGRLSFEPKPNGSESWVILVHRAIMQAEGVDWHDKDAYSSGQCWDVMPYLTGRPADSHEAYGIGFSDSFILEMHAALAFHKVVCAGTRQGDYGPWAWDVSTPKVIGSHCYEVVSVNVQAKTITLRNPWGVDGGSGSGDPTDGLVTVTWDQFHGSFDTVGIS